jgi:hypothetical protein
VDIFFNRAKKEAARGERRKRIDARGELRANTNVKETNSLHSLNVADVLLCVPVPVLVPVPTPSSKSVNRVCSLPTSILISLISIVSLTPSS